MNEQPERLGRVLKAGQTHEMGMFFGVLTSTQLCFANGIALLCEDDHDEYFMVIAAIQQTPTCCERFDWKVNDSTSMSRRNKYIQSAVGRDLTGLLLNGEPILTPGFHMSPIDAQSTDINIAFGKRDALRFNGYIIQQGCEHHPCITGMVTMPDALGFLGNDGRWRGEW